MNSLRSLLATEWVAKTDFYAAASAASAVSIYYVVIGGRFAPPYKYMIKYIQQKQQQKQSWKMAVKYAVESAA